MHSFREVGLNLHRETLWNYDSANGKMRADRQTFHIHFYACKLGVGFSGVPTETSSHAVLKFSTGFPGDIPRAFSGVENRPCIILLTFSFAEINNTAATIYKENISGGGQSDENQFKYPARINCPLRRIY